LWLDYGGTKENKELVSVKDMRGQLFVLLLFSWMFRLLMDRCDEYVGFERATRVYAAVGGE
jgi:hypothetical protein